MKYAIDSSGNAIALQASESPIRLIPQSIREKELVEFAQGFTELLSQKNIDVLGKRCCFMIQPYYTTERLLFFAKTELSASSKAVKLANEIEQHPEILAHRERLEFLQSIVPDDSTGRPRWYFLSIGYIAFERNLYDCKYINMKYVQPVPYAQFMRELKKQLVSPESSNSENQFHFRLIANGAELQNAPLLLPYCFDRDITDGNKSSFDRTVYDTAMYYKKLHINGDEKSNIASTCLTTINNSSRNVFPVYKQVKNIIVKTFKGAYNVQYKGNCITAQIDNLRRLEIFVCGTDDNPVFIVGGRKISGLDKLAEACKFPSVFEEFDWYVEKVKPYIEIKKTVRAKRIKPKDELGWTKKR